MIVIAMIFGEKMLLIYIIEITNHPFGLAMKRKGQKVIGVVFEISVEITSVSLSYRWAHRNGSTLRRVFTSL